MNALTSAFPPPPALPGGQPNNNASAPSQPAAAVPAPTHAQTVAALRHFSLINDALEPLLRNPELGRADVRPSVIDAVTKLVGDRILTPQEAVKQLNQFPDRPFDQKRALALLYSQNLQAEMAVLQHHRQAFVGTGHLPTEATLHSDNSDNHISAMSGLMTHYGKK